MHHTKRGIIAHTSKGVEFTPMPCPPSPVSALWDGLFESLFHSLPARANGAVPVGATGYLDMFVPEDFDECDAVIALCDNYNRKGIALRLVRTDGQRSVEVLHQRYEGGDGPVVSATGQTAVIGGPVGPEELGRLVRLLSGEMLPAVGSSNPRWRLDR